MSSIKRVMSEVSITHMYKNLTKPYQPESQQVGPRGCDKLTSDMKKQGNKYELYVIVSAAGVRSIL